VSGINKFICSQSPTIGSTEMDWSAIILPFFSDCIMSTTHLMTCLFDCFPAGLARGMGRKKTRKGRTGARQTILSGSG
jgi:hypothetical protein